MMLGRRRAGRPLRIEEVALSRYRVVEICAGAGGQSLGLELAGFEHELSVELDQNAAATLRHNRPHWKVAIGDVANPDVWDPAGYVGIDLVAGGVPCPPFTIAGKQLGATDERDLFAWAIELCGIMLPRALMLENVRGLSLPRFAAYRQHVLDRLVSLGYAADWRLLHAADHGVERRFRVGDHRILGARRRVWGQREGLLYLGLCTGHGRCRQRTVE